MTSFCYQQIKISTLHVEMLKFIAIWCIQNLRFNYMESDFMFLVKVPSLACNIAIPAFVEI